MRFIVRWTFRLLFIAAAALAVSALMNLKREWELLSEDEIRDRLHHKLDGRVSDEQMEMISDKVVTVLKGVPSQPTVADTAPEAAEEIIEEAKEAAGE